ncbi:MAG: 2-oxoacid:acceptor oxidoreductase family protein, partial [Firmicutes bacterium]|nr:2-oxoacid:acceptor oxidoreductase family protein [Bacillota bacterium]MBQ3123132.1 2-oxoacid:acceptor oxidoreductase family protein [Bacillota bacterium]
MLKEIICAGFGGQGIITTGILISYCAFETGSQFTWYPSYGSEMRGGTANCTIKVSDEEIASPLAKEIDILVGMS